MPLKPYYGPEDGITIYHGDCREILPQLPKVDLVLTDPPYGIGADKANAHSSIRDNEKWPDMKWDVRPSSFLIQLALNKGKNQIIWGGNYFSLFPSRCWLVWNKPERNFSLADAELAWTNFDAAVRVFDYPRSDGERAHPTQKPLALMKWCIQQCRYDDLPQTVLDPFMGSGTTLRAAKDLGRKATGIEIEEKYCEIAAKRLAQKVLQF